MGRLIRYEEATFQKDSLDIVDFVAPYWKEIHLSTHTKLPYEPDLALIDELAVAGLLRGIVGRDERGEMASVYLATFTPCIFSKSSLIATECLWYIRPDLRSIKTLKELLSEIETFHKKYNVLVSQISMHTNRLEKLMTKHQYSLNEYWFSRRYN